MPTANDNSEYEHQSELIALKKILEEIPKVNTITEINCGYGRLLPTYFHRAKRIVLTDPSAKHIKRLQYNIKTLQKTQSLKKTNIKIIRTKAENLRGKIYKNTVDLVIAIRVIHHLNDPKATLMLISKILKKDGYLILEFPNKVHGKAMLTNFLHGNLVYSADILPKEIGKNIKNYHPEMIKALLIEQKFEILAMRSVSNIRSQKLKQHLPLPTLIWLEEYLQTFLAKFNFGPSIFILAKKRG